MTPLSQWPIGRVALVAALWPVATVAIAVLIPPNNVAYIRQADGTRVFSLFAVPLRDIVYWIAFLPPLVLIGWRAVHR